jgi:hypothetical protein
MTKDPIVEEVQTIRDRLAAKFNYDLKAIIEDAKKRQYETGHAVVSFVREPEQPYNRNQKK